MGVVIIAKKKDKNKRPTNRANLSQNMDKRRNLPTGLDKDSGQNPK